MEIEIVANEDAKLPTCAHEDDAGMDLYSSEETLIDMEEQKIIKTGIKMAIPKGYVGLIWDKSGNAAKHGVHVLAGVIDSGYRGEIGIVVKVLGNKPFKVDKHMKIAQLLIQPIVQAELKAVNNLDNTERGDAGFGSTKSK